MKNYKLSILILLIMALSLLFSWLLLHQLYFSMIMTTIFILATGYAIYRDQQKKMRRVENMIANIHYGDLNVSFTGPAKGVEAELARSMNEALAAFRTRLYQSVVAETENEAWQKLIRVLTHEIMNSMAPILSLSETVTERASLSGVNEKDYRIMLESMRTIQRRSKGLVEFVENYRKLTRIPKPDLRNFPARELFAHISELFPDPEYRLELRITPDNLLLHADPVLLEQVLINLVKNGYEASADIPSPLVTLTAFRRERKTLIAVTDSGSGILPEALDKVFVPFFTTKPGGSGIGLAICRQIINRHGGTITVHSQPDQGTTFTLEFPPSLQL